MKAESLSFQPRERAGVGRTGQKGPFLALHVDYLIPSGPVQLELWAHFILAVETDLTKALDL